MLKILRRMEYNNLIIPQEETLSFVSPKKQRLKNTQHRCEKIMGGGLGKLQPTTGNSKTRLIKKSKWRHHKGLWIMGNLNVVT